MPRIKSNSVKVKRSPLNTTINDEILTDFKDYCFELGLPMNLILESFMSQFIDGELVLKIGKSNKLKVDLVENDGNDSD